MAVGGRQPPWSVVVCGGGSFLPVLAVVLVGCAAAPLLLLLLLGRLLGVLLWQVARQHEASASAACKRHSTTRIGD